MGINQTIWSLDNKRELNKSQSVSEAELEDLLFNNIKILSNDWIVLGRQIRTKNGGYIDILCLDREGNTVVVELKKDMTPREVTAQGLDYAAWVSKLDSTDIASIHLKQTGKSIDEVFNKQFNIELGDEINMKTKIVIVAARMDVSTEDIITYLQTFNVDMNILYFSVYETNGERLLSRAWFIDEEVQDEKKEVVKSLREWNGEFYSSFGLASDNNGRSWDDARKYGFISANGGIWYTQTLSLLHPGDRVWVNIPHTGFVGVGKVIKESTPAREANFIVDGKEIKFTNLNLQGKYQIDTEDEMQEYIVTVEWLHTIDINHAVREVGFFGNQNTVCKPKAESWDFTIDRLKQVWGIHE